MNDMSGQTGNAAIPAVLHGFANLSLSTVVCKHLQSIAYLFDKEAPHMAFT